MDTKYVDVPVRLDRTVADKIATLAVMCGLTNDQMASAMFVLSLNSLPAPKPKPKAKTKAKTTAQVAP